MARITGIAYDVFDRDTFVRDVSCCPVTSWQTYDERGNVVAGGLKDLRLGADLRHPCATCRLTFRDCPGHMGHIDLVVPVWHPIYGYGAGKDWDNPTVRMRQTVPPSLVEKSGTVVSAKTFLETPGRNAKRVLTFVAVPPNCVRPTSVAGGRRCGEDDLTRSLMRIVRANDEARKVLANVEMEETAKTFAVQEKVKVLQKEVCAYINDHGPNAKRKSIRMRLDGKTGRFRSSLMGKRCDYTMRTVVTGNPRLRYDEFGVPAVLAKNMTVRVNVTAQNIDLLRTSATAVILPGGRRAEGTQWISVGCVAERPMRNGDIVLMNRQPSLHRPSIMAGRARLVPGHTLQIKPDATTPWNADFDGDEMNLHLPQTIEARAEALELMAVSRNVVGSNARNRIGMIQDALVGAHLLLRESVGRADAMQMMTMAWFPDIPPLLPEGTQIPGVDLFVMLLPDCLRYKSREELMSKKAKTFLGTTHGSLVHWVHKHIGADACLDWLHRLQQMIQAFLDLRGFTVSFRDVLGDCSDTVQKVLHKAVASGDPFALNQVRAEVYNEVLARDEGSTRNGLRQMVASGSKGSTSNVAQLMACVGQQNLLGGRMPLHLTTRTLTWFHESEKSAESRGFCTSSYVQGLRPAEYVFHTAAGREGISDTALKTSDTGYLQRQQVKCLEDVVVQYDASVRTGSGAIVQFRYGGDGWDPRELWRVGDDRVPVDLRDCPGTRPAKEVLHLSSDPKWLRHVTEMSDAGVLVDTARVREFVDRAQVAAGESVGVIAAQAMGEPLSQATLNTFHQAGSAEAVNQGVPRFKQILHLSNPERWTLDTEVDVGLLEPVRRSDISATVSAPPGTSWPFWDAWRQIPEPDAADQVFAYDVCVRLELKRTSASLAMPWIVDALVQALPWLPDAVVYSDVDAYLCFGRQCPPDGIVYLLEQIEPDQCLTGIDVRGFCRTRDGHASFDALKTSSDAGGFLTRLDPRITSDSAKHVAESLGIAAAERVLRHEIEQCIASSGCEIDPRHVGVLVDWMSRTGTLTSVSRFGVKDANTLRRSTFETATTVVADAAFAGRRDPIRGVSESVIVGERAKCGTGMMDVLPVKEEEPEEQWVPKSPEYDPFVPPCADPYMDNPYMQQPQSPQYAPYTPPPYSPEWNAV